MPEEKIISSEILRQIETQIFKSFGFSDEGASIIADSLLEADLRGVSSHGAIRIPVYAARLQHGVVFPDGPLDIVEDHGAMAVIDGHDTFGQILGTKAMQLAIKKASEYGIGCVGVRNSHHYGTAAYYAQMAAEEGMVGFSTTNTTPLMPPSGGAAKMVGNNPVAFAMPAGKYPPIVLDMACSTVAHGKIQVAAKKNLDIPLGWATDSDGKPTTDAQKALKGFLSPVGAHKGFGLAVIMDLLCGPLIGGLCGGHITGLNGCYERPQGCGHFFIAFNIKNFTTQDAYNAGIEAYIEYIKSCPKVDESSVIYMPGEIEHKLREKRIKNGIPMPQTIVDDLITLCRNLGIDSTGLA